MLKVFCARSMHVAVTTLSQQFAGNSGASPDIVFEPMGALQTRIAAGETADVFILATPAIDALAKSGAIESASRAEVARALIGVAIRDGAPEPDIATPGAFKTALIAARTIALSDPAVGGSAGLYLRDLFGRIGLADMIAAKTVKQKSGVAAADAVGRGEADLAMTFIPELLQGNGRQHPWPAAAAIRSCHRLRGWRIGEFRNSGCGARIHRGVNRTRRARRVDGG